MTRRARFKTLAVMMGFLSACSSAEVVLEPVPETAIVSESLEGPASLADGWSFTPSIVCGGEPTPLDELLEPVAATDVEYGEDGSWFEVGSLAVMGEPLDPVIPVLAVVDEYGPTSCILRNTLFDVALQWEVVDRQDDVVRLLTTCDDLEPDVELVGDHAAVVLIRDDQTPAQPFDDRCEIEVELGSSTAEVVSGLAWPFVAPSGDHFDVLLERDAAVVAAQGGLELATCRVEASTAAITVFWESVPYGTEPVVLRDGVEVIRYPSRTNLDRRFDEWHRTLQLRLFPGAEFIEDEAPEFGWSGAFTGIPEPDTELHTFEIQLSARGVEARTISCGSASRQTELGAATCRVELAGGLPLVVIDDSSLSTTAILRDGEPLPFEAWERRVDADVTVGATYAYSVTRNDPLGNVSGDVIDCGSIQIPEPLEPGIDQLIESEKLFLFSAVGPHARMDVAPIDGGVVGEERLVWMTYRDGPDGRLDFLEPQEELANPFDVYDLLIDAIENGSEVEYTINPASGVVTEFMIDGAGQRISCFAFDVLPPGDFALCDQLPDLDLVRR